MPGGCRGVRAAVAAAGVALLLAATGTGCTAGTEHSDEARLRVDEPVALADEPVRIRVTGLLPGEEVTVTSRATDWEGTRWSAWATVVADASGTVDLTRDRPRDGTYREVDGMGLFWSMRPEEGPADEAWFIPLFPEVQPDYEVDLAVEAGGERIAERTLTRTWAASGVEQRVLTVADDGVAGVLYLPPAGSPARAPVLLLGGSGGGTSMPFDAALLASRGHPALALCYFRCTGRPDTLERIELEYFAAAARLLGEQGDADAGPPAVIGYSRGVEAAQLLAHHFPDLVHDVVLYAPTRHVNAGYPDGGVAWTLDGEPVTHPRIPLDRVRGTVLAIAGTEDALWPAAHVDAEEIADERGASGQQHRALVYEGAGHGVGTFPYTASGRTLHSPVSGEDLSMGGTAAADAAARADGWPRVLELLAD